MKTKNPLPSFTPPNETYGVFSHIIIWRFSVIYEQVPLEGWDEKYWNSTWQKSLIKYVKTYKFEREENPVRLCLVLSKGECYYFEGNKIEKFTNIPSVWTFVVINAKHFKGYW